jgi:hypothetical protein
MSLVSEGLGFVTSSLQRDSSPYLVIFEILTLYYIMNTFTSIYYDRINDHSSAINELAHEIHRHNTARYDVNNALRNYNNNVKYHQNLNCIEYHIQQLLLAEDSLDGVGEIIPTDIYSHLYVKQRLSRQTNKGLLPEAFPHREI